MMKLTYHIIRKEIYLSDDEAFTLEMKVGEGMNYCPDQSFALRNAQMQYLNIATK